MPRSDSAQAGSRLATNLAKAHMAIRCWLRVWGVCSRLSRIFWKGAGTVWPGLRRHRFRPGSNRHFFPVWMAIPSSAGRRLTQTAVASGQLFVNNMFHSPRQRKYHPPGCDEPAIARNNMMNEQMKDRSPVFGSGSGSFPSAACPVPETSPGLTGMDEVATMDRRIAPPPPTAPTLRS